MATHYITNESSGNQYYFNTTSTNSHSYGSTPVASTYGSSVYSAYPVGSSNTSHQQILLDGSLPTSQQYQSVAGFNKSVPHQNYHTSHSSTHQVRPTARAVSNQDLNSLSRSPQPMLVSPQHHHLQFDNRQQPGHPTGPPVVYQTPGAAQFTHRNVDMWTEGSPQNHDHYVQAQRVSVRSVSTGSPQQSHSVSPHRNQDQLQKYYSQLTPEQQQQLLRNQQLQRQQEQNSHNEQQHHVTAHQISPSSSHRHEQHGSAGGFDGGQHNQQRRFRSDSERQQQDEQDYYAAQSRFTAQRIQQQQVQESAASHPVGIRGLMNKFVEPTSNQARSKSSTTTRHHSSSTYSHAAVGSRQTKPQSFTPYAMTYSALPKAQEPPVNSVEYYQMQVQKQGGVPFTSIQQAAAPTHIHHAATGFGALRDRFKTGPTADDFYQPQQPVNRPQQQPPQQSSSVHNGGSSLSSLKNQYINQAKQSEFEQLPPHLAQKIPRTIVGEDLPQVYEAQHAAVYQPPVQQQKPVTSQVLPQPQQQQPLLQTAAPQQQQSPPQPTPQNPVQQQQQQQPAPQAPIKKEQEPAPQTSTQSEQKSAPATASTQPQEQKSEAAPKPQAEPVKEVAKQSPEPVKEAPKPQVEPAKDAAKQSPEPAKEAPKPQAEPTKEAPKQPAEPAKEAAKQKTESSAKTSESQAAKQPTSTTAAAKKEPAKPAATPADKKSPS